MDSEERLTMRVWDSASCSPIGNMNGFKTRDKVPTAPWKTRHNRYKVKLLLDDTSVSQVGIVPGENDCVVIDCDVKNGVNGIDSLCDVFPKLRDGSYSKDYLSLSYRTKSGGRHIWYRVPFGCTIPQKTGRLPGIDIRYDRGYVCVNGDYIVVGEIRDCPEDIFTWLQDDGKKHVTNKHSIDGGRSCKRYNTSPIPKGMRNNTLNSWGYGILNDVKSGNLSESQFRDIMRTRADNSMMPTSETDVIIDNLLSIIYCREKSS